MILDKRIEFADNLLVNTGAPASFIVGDTYDLQAIRDVGSGEDLYLAIVVSQAFTGAGASVQYNLVTADDAALTVGLGVLATSPIVPVAGLILGRQIFVFDWPAEGTPYKRYIGLQQVTIGAAFTGGRIDAYVVQSYARIRNYQDAIN